MTQCGHFLRPYEAVYQYQSASPQDEEWMSMSKNGNKIAVVGGASRIGCAAMTVAAAAILTASTLRAEPLEQTSPDAVIQALQGVYGAHPGFRKNHAKGTCPHGPEPLVEASVPRKGIEPLSKCVVTLRLSLLR